MEASNNETPTVITESPKPMAFTIDFNNGKSIDTQRAKNLMDKFSNKHRRGQSLSKIEPTPTTPTKLPLTGKLPRKSSFQSDGYFSSDEKTDRKKSELSLQLKNTTVDRMTQSLTLNMLSPEVDLLKDTSSPELDMTSPFSPLKGTTLIPILNQNNSQDSEGQFVDGSEFDFDKSDTVSDAGTYTLDGDNYSEEQKARMSIDREFKLEQVSQRRKAEEYVQSLGKTPQEPPTSITKGVLLLNLNGESHNKLRLQGGASTKLSPILSPTQNLSIVDEKQQNNSEDLNKTFTKIMFPTPTKEGTATAASDKGNIVSVTSSGAFRLKSEQEKRLQRKYSLTKSEVQVEAYIDDVPISPKLSARIINVQNIQVNATASASLPPNGKSSPTKIPSPMHSLTRSRSRNSLSVDFSDTEMLLRPTQNYINALQQRLSMDNSDADSDYDVKYGMQLNNTAHLLKQRASHTRHNSLDMDRTTSNKLQHFQSKNLQSIDQTYSNVFINQYSHKIQNSPNNSPIRRSSSFSAKNLINKNNNQQQQQKESNLRSPSLSSRNNTAIQRSSSTACIRPNYHRRASLAEQQKIDTESSSEEDFEKNLQKRANITNTRCNRAFSLRRARLEDAAASAQPSLQCPNTPEMRRKYTHVQSADVRAISMDRKSAMMKSNEVQSRYMQSIAKKPPVKVVEVVKSVPKSAAKLNRPQAFSRTDSGRFSMRASSKPPIVAGGPRLMPNKKELVNGKKSGGPRSNSSLSSREMEFQNWKRRKSYDPMKAAAEGKKKEIAKRQSLNVMTQSYTDANYSQDSSPSHSSSVHRSQSFHGTAALDLLISSEDEEDDLTLSADEGGFSPPTPSPCELSPARATLRHTLWERINNHH